MLSGGLNAVHYFASDICKGQSLFILEPCALTSSSVKMSDSVDSQHMCSRLSHSTVQLEGPPDLNGSWRHPHHQKAFIQYLPVPFISWKEFIFEDEQSFSLT